MIFPEMDAKADVPEITEACRGLQQVADGRDVRHCPYGRQTQGRAASDRRGLHVVALQPGV
jgi:hypothetical protein